MTCKNLRIRTKKEIKYCYCAVLKKEIKYSDCTNCEYKGYKMHNKSKMLCKSKKIKTKSNKLAKLERNRFSVFTDDLDTCYLCNRDKQELHEIFWFCSSTLSQMPL